MNPPGRGPTRHDFGRRGRGRAFHNLPADLSRALYLLKVSDVQQGLLMEVIEKTLILADLEREDPKPCRMNLSDFAREWGVSQQYVSVQAKALVADQVLLKIDGLYSLNTDVWAWIASGRVDGRHLDRIIDGYLENGRLSCRSKPRSRTPRVDIPAPPGSPSPQLGGCEIHSAGVVDATAPELYPHSAGVVDATAPELYPHSAGVVDATAPELYPAPAPYRNAGNYHKNTELPQDHYNNSREEPAPASGEVDVVAPGETAEEPKPQGASARLKPGSRDDLPPGGNSSGPHADPELHPTSGRPLVRNDRDEVLRVAELAERAFPDQELGRKVREHGLPGPRGPANNWIGDIEYAVLDAKLKEHQEGLRKPPWHCIKSSLDFWMRESDGYPTHTAADCRVLAKFIAKHFGPRPGDRGGYFDPNNDDD